MRKAGNSPERRLWIREEVIRAIDLYCRTRFGRMHSHNPDIIALAKELDRTPNSVALKLTNFASLDPTLDRAGMKNVSKLDRKMWEEFFQDTDAFFAMVAQMESGYVTPPPRHHELPGFREGEDYKITAKARRNQDYFRDMILATYDNKCCITKIAVPEVLVASHIIPWAQRKGTRTDPRNGLCLNALHDKAFDRGLIVIDDNYRVRVAPKLKERGYTVFNEHDGNQIELPDRFLPSKEFLREHREAHSNLY